MVVSWERRGVSVETSFGKFPFGNKHLGTMLYSRFDKELNKRELNLLLQGGGGGGELKRPKPTGAPWLTDVAWTKILELDNLGEPEGQTPGIPLFKNYSHMFAEEIEGMLCSDEIEGMVPTITVSTSCDVYDVFICIQETTAAGRTM